MTAANTIALAEFMDALGRYPALIQGISKAGMFTFTTGSV